MPGSSKKGKLNITKWFQQIPNVRYVLDIGPGWATYSKLLRKKNHIWHAVEIFEPYVARFKLEKYYDQIFISDISIFLPKVFYDVIILGDVLEHLPNKKSQKVLAKVFSHSKYCIISLPLDAETHAPSENSSQYWKNKHEIHTGSWSNKSFQDAVKDNNGEIIAMEKYEELGIYFIATLARDKYIDPNIVNPKEWFLFYYSKWYENAEHNQFKTYRRKIKSKAIILLTILKII